MTGLLCTQLQPYVAHLKQNLKWLPLVVEMTCNRSSDQMTSTMLDSASLCILKTADALSAQFTAYNQAAVALVTIASNSVSPSGQN